MRVFCEDHRLNISPAYLRPGVLLRRLVPPEGPARADAPRHGSSDVDVPMLSGVMRATNRTSGSRAGASSTPAARRSHCWGSASSRRPTTFVRARTSSSPSFCVGKGIERQIYDPIVAARAARRREPALRRDAPPAPPANAVFVPGGGASRRRDRRRRDCGRRGRPRAARRADSPLVLDLHGGLGPSSRACRATAGSRGDGHDARTAPSSAFSSSSRTCRSRSTGASGSRPGTPRRRVRRLRRLPARARTRRPHEVLDGIRDPPLSTAAADARGTRPTCTSSPTAGCGRRACVVRAYRAEGFDVIQACNPPDTFWALALPFKLGGKRFVFDQHDLCPEVYESRFPRGSRASSWAPCGCSSGRPTPPPTTSSRRTSRTERRRCGAATWSRTTSRSFAPAPIPSGCGAARRPGVAPRASVPLCLPRRHGPAGRRRPRPPRRRRARPAGPRRHPVRR